jgi:hypothetical protein
MEGVLGLEGAVAAGLRALELAQHIGVHIPVRSQRLSAREPFTAAVVIARILPVHGVCGAHVTLQQRGAEVGLTTPLIARALVGPHVVMSIHMSGQLVGLYARVVAAVDRAFQRLIHRMRQSMAPGIDRRFRHFSATNVIAFESIQVPPAAPLFAHFCMARHVLHEQTLMNEPFVASVVIARKRCVLLVNDPHVEFETRFGGELFDARVMRAPVGTDTSVPLHVSLHLVPLAVIDITFNSLVFHMSVATGHGFRSLE